MTSHSLLPAQSNDVAGPFFDNGYLFPVDVFSAAQAASYRQQLEGIEAQVEGQQIGNKDQFNLPHVLLKFANEIVRNPRILDVVEAIIGPDILVWGSTFFIKEPRTDTYVSWHQDLRYWGLSDDNGQVSAWVALGPVNKANGCMRFVPGSHKGEIVAHKDTFEDDNFLTRGQEADIDINENEVVHVELEPGQASFHHGRLLHASAPNHSDVRRVGFAINYVATHVSQTLAKKDFGMLVRGQDVHNNFTHVPPPADDLSAEAMSWHHTILHSQHDALYDGVEPAAP